MSGKARIDRVGPWAWCERRVDPAEEHFELYYRPTVDLDSWSDIVLIARVGTPLAGAFRVEFLVKPGTDNFQTLIDAATKELNFYLVELHEKDPWWYAKYHCTTMSNIYSHVYWSYFEKGRLPNIGKALHSKEAFKTERSAVSLPAVQSLLLPVLKMTADGKSVAEIRERLRETLHINPSDARRKHKSGVNIYVNRVAWALSHLVTGKAITLKERGRYQVTNRGLEILKSNPSELTIQDLH